MILNQPGSTRLSALQTHKVGGLFLFRKEQAALAGAIPKLQVIVERQQLG